MAPLQRGPDGCYLVGPDAGLKCEVGGRKGWGKGCALGHRRSDGEAGGLLLGEGWKDGVDEERWDNAIRMGLP